jgi:hypothetical protein
MRLGLLFAVALLQLSCKGTRSNEKHWKDQRATHAEVAGFTVVFPAHWRDARELVKPLDPPPPEEMVELIPDDDSSAAKVVSAEVAVANVPVVKGDDCAHLAERIVGEVQISDPEAATFDGDPGCLMRASANGSTGKVMIRTHGDRAVFVRCFGGHDVDSACDAVVYALKPTGAQK